MKNKFRSVGGEVLFLLVGFVFVGCESLHKTIILDEPTPRGEIEPPRPLGDNEIVTPPYRSKSAISEYSAKETQLADFAVPLADFEAAYRKAGRPRLALYVNRRLSDDVREWVSDRRLRIGYTETTISTASSGKVAANTIGTATVGVQVPSDDGIGRAKVDQWIWRLEDSISQLLMRGGARIVDRSMILRLAATTRGHNPNEDEPVKLIEMLALKNAADILIEVEISSCPDDVLGYIFRSRAVKIKDGLLLSTTSSASWGRTGRTGSEWVATNEGYERRGLLPKPEVLGHRLAQDIMRGLTTSL